ncbi:MAG: hypothetical protein ABFS56_20615 [Pseudomonadota bacterium]
MALVRKTHPTLAKVFSRSQPEVGNQCHIVSSVTECKLWQAIEALQEENKALRQQLTESISAFFHDPLKDGSLGPKMVWIPAGTFQMGGVTLMKNRYMRCQ